MTYFARQNGIRTFYESKVNKKELFFRRKCYFIWSSGDKYLVMSFYFAKFVKLQNFVPFHFVLFGEKDVLRNTELKKISLFCEITKCYFPSICRIFTKLNSAEPYITVSSGEASYRGHGKAALVYL